MVSDQEPKEDGRSFEPLEIVGIFWLLFGLLIVAATFFVEATPRVPLVRGVVTNLVAGALMVGIGWLSIVRGRARRARREREP